MFIQSEGGYRFLFQFVQAVDQPGDCTDDFSNTAVGGKYGCRFGNTGDTDWVGRFTPDHFTVAELDDVYLYTVDDLKSVAEQGRQSRLAAAGQAEEVIDIDVRHYMT